MSYHDRSPSHQLERWHTARLTNQALSESVQVCMRHRTTFYAVYKLDGNFRILVVYGHRIARTSFLNIPLRWVSECFERDSSSAQDAASFSTPSCKPKVERGSLRMTVWLHGVNNIITNKAVLTYKEMIERCGVAIVMDGRR
jgi:hypothetical protein